MKILYVALLLLSIPVLAAPPVACHLPKSGGDAAAAKPGITGSVYDMNVVKKVITLVPPGRGSRKISVDVSALAADHIFAQFEGGTALLSGISKNDQIQVWSSDCAGPKENLIKADVLVVMK